MPSQSPIQDPGNWVVALTAIPPAWESALGSGNLRSLNMFQEPRNLQTAASEPDPRPDTTEFWKLAPAACNATLEAAPRAKGPAPRAPLGPNKACGGALT